MGEIFETVMLLCFGASWPLAVYRNFTARTAVGMSVGFIVLIITGYIAGIVSKISVGNYSYVLIVYIFNLLMVSLNLAVYFRNKRLDALKNAEKSR